MKAMVIEIKLSIEEYLQKIRPYLKDVMNDIKNLIGRKFNWQYQLILFLVKAMVTCNAFKEW